ncbi:hypothetical protein JTB14_004019 [Gonioctena quinquepunctata]|nr:hypothetical protein JTB14_004019 [Gonioctena quinquepunctata]
MSKKGISQYSIDLKFGTKRFISRLYGYISKTESSLEASLYNDYKFLHMKEQRVTLTFGAANRSHKNIVVFEGFSRLVSSAYPNMNFAANATIQNIGGHTDITFKVHQNPLSKDDPDADFETLKFELLLSSKIYSDSKRQFKVVSILSKKASNLDLKGEFIYETFRHNITTAFLVKYGKNKEVSVTIFWSHPRTALEQIKTHVNVTIPSFTPMILKLDITEKAKKDYMIDFWGTWFSGHSMSAVGFYQDKSTSLSSHHHIKLLLRSPSFEDFNVDLRFYRDNDVLRLDLKGLHNNKDEYELSFNHRTVSQYETRNQATIKYINQLYRYVGSVYDGDYRKIDAELHIDQLRDIVFSVYILNQENNKSLGFDINWDANRDPDQKLMISANYLKNATFDYISNFIVSYPGRTIKGDYKFLLERKHLETLASLSWDDGKTLAIDLDILYEYDERLYLEIDTQLNTPFNDWKILKLDGRFEHLHNKYDLQGVMSWDRQQRVTVDLFGDYTSRESYFTCKYSCSIRSSTDRIPNINTTISHTQNETNFDTNLHLMYNPEFVVGVDSQWRIDSNHEFTNLTGTLRSRTPFKGMNRAVLVSKIMTKNKKYIKGAAQLDVDHKKIDIDMEGFFKKITNCKLVINATTPGDDYQLRYIISTERKQFIAMVNYPTGSLGTEVVFSMNNIIDFDVRFHLATPVEFLQDLIVVAKLRPEEADFRLGWNFLLLGFSGVWHYANVTDFEYSYKIYTPIEDFEENGIVGKLILKEGLDFEVSMKLSNYKLGTKLVGHPKPKPLKELGMKMNDIYTGSKLPQVEERDAVDPFSWKGLIELDIIIYSTIKGELEIDQKGNSYILQCKLTMPHGVAHILDEFEFEDILKMKNYLEVSTPYPAFKNIMSNFELNIEAGHIYVFDLDFNYENRTELAHTGVSAKYIVERKGAEERMYNVTLKVNTPFKAFPKLNLFGAFETEENFYHTKLLFNTNRSDISVDATTEIDVGFLEFTSQFHVTTPSVYIPECQLKLTKSSSDANNNLEVNLQVPKKLQSEIHLKTTWRIKSRSDFRTTIQLDTPYSGLENTTAALDVYLTGTRSTVWTYLQMSPLEVEVNAELAKDVLKAYSNLNFNGQRYPVTVDCKILKPSENRREFDGNLKFKDKLFIITGVADLIGNIPSRVSMKFAPEDNTPPLTFEYQLSPTSLDKYKLIGSIQHAEKFSHFNADLTSRGTFDWELKFQIDTSNNEKFIFNTRASSAGNSVNLNIDAYTPIPRLENPKLGASFSTKGLQKDIFGYFEVTNARGNATLSYVWVYLENMKIKAVGKFENHDYGSESSVEAFYENPQKTFYFIKAGGDIKVDRLWESGTNVTLIIPPAKKMNLEAHLKNELYEEKIWNLGKGFQEDKQNLSGNIELEWNSNRFNNFANLKRSEKTLDLIYKLKSPKFIDRQLLVTEIKYKSLGDHHNLTCEAFYPEDRSVAYGTVDYKELANMNGMFNITIPHRSLNYTGANFKTQSNANAYNRYIKVFWDGDNAVLDSMCDIKTSRTLLDRNMKGKLIIELPLTTRHIAAVDYEYDKNAQVSVGGATVDYNRNKVVEGKYKCVSQSRAGFDKDTVHVEIQNQLVPVGADYIYKHAYGAGPDAPVEDNKSLHLYHLKDRSKFNVNGELNIRTTSGGQEYIITAIHANRTIRFWTDYDVLDKEYKQHSRLELSPSHWIEYNLDLLNNTVDEIFDAQQVVINVIYPRRSFTARGSYNISDSIVSSDVSLVWDKDNKTVQAGLDWRRALHHREQLLFQIKHPSFQRDVTFYSEYGYNKSTIDGQLVVDYSLNQNQKLTLGGKVNDNSDSLTYNYTYNVWAEHNATNLNLKSRGDFYWNPSAFGTEHITNYQRSYLPLSTSESLARVSMDNNEIELKKDNIASGKSYFWSRYEGKYPVYTANMSASYDTNDTEGEFYINFEDKLLYANFNMTEDGSQSMHLYGIIPDARSAMCDIWRDYEDRRVSDVSYYLRLNHSRLLMSRLKWRPELISDVQTNIRETIMMFYTDTLEGINNTKQYVKAEMLDALNGVWMDARPLVQDSIADLRNLTMIEGDIEELRVFLNESYYNNEFYIRDITNIVVNMFDQFALKSHLQSLPKIVQEVWSVLGDSGQKIKKSVLWVIEKIKFYYKNTTEFIHELINGDPIEHISTGLDKLLEKYDRYIKDLHVSVIKYMENVWSQFSTLLVEHWHAILASVEPTFLKLIHYLETIIWNTGKEFLGFLYERKNEIIDSPFFVQFTKLSHDIDDFWKDLSGNNTIASVYKYSEITWEFVTEKYLKLIPFGRELLDIATEIVTELKQIGAIPSVKYFVDKWNETFKQVRYYYEYFDMEGRIHRFVTMVFVKISEMSVTALENENRQRIPKTNFILEPNDGIMLLEQKLPMPWHAFNETPKFKEIPEIKRIYDLWNYLEVAQISFWNLYYDYKLLTDPTEWMPPFKGYAMFAGSSYYVTFDKTYYDFRGKCTYLLATDFIDRNFTLLVSNDVGNNSELILILNKKIVRINMFKDEILIGDSRMERLPAQIGGTYLYRNAGIFIVESSSGFMLECNMKFHTCTFKLSGWYFGKTAGLWGTFNNEPSDDFLTSKKIRANTSSLDIFGDSWALEKSCKTGIQNAEKPKLVPKEVVAMCDEFFTSKISQLSTCFPRIPKDSFLSMCLNSTNEQEACMSAVSYINLCSYANTPLRIPDTCVKCNLLNGTEKREGNITRLHGNDVPRSADVVFIVEAKKCNKDLKKSRNFEIVVEFLEKELRELNITDNKYAVVVFGGDGVYEEPRSIIVDGKTFTDSRSILSYFDNIHTGNGSSDIFNGIMFAYNLIFRPGVSRNFVLVPCSECNKYNMLYDYSTIHQLLYESAISLHILMNDQFRLQKERDVKIPFGIDRRYAYTKRDVRGLVGDQPLRKSIILPKSTLGLCLSLAMETNGTIFSGKLLESEKKNAKKIATVFAKTVARSAAPMQCVDCECTAGNTGIAYMECYVCTMSSIRYSPEIYGSDDEEDYLMNNMNFLDAFTS